MKKIRILIADDHDVVRSGLRMLFKGTPGFAVIAEATNGEEAVALVGKHKPDIAILDISMPKINGIEATRMIKEKKSSTRVLILTIHENEEYVYQMVRAGASGYVLKNAGKKELFAAVRAVAAGERFFSPGISNLMIDEFIKRAKTQEPSGPALQHDLTNREIEILRYIGQGLTNAQIAKQLYLSVRTVDTHRTNLMQKLKIHDTVGLVKYALEAGLLDINAK
jgi:two-component system response regulator NreC